MGEPWNICSIDVPMRELEQMLHVYDRGYYWSSTLRREAHLSELGPKKKGTERDEKDLREVCTNTDSTGIHDDHDSYQFLYEEYILGEPTTGRRNNMID